VAAHAVHGGVELELDQLPALTLLREWAEVAVRVMPILVVIQDAKDRNAALAEVIPMFASMGTEADMLAQRLLVTGSATFTDSEGERKLLDLTSRAAINEAFAGNLLGLFQAIFFAVEVHYGDFLSGAGASSSGREKPPAGKHSS